MNFICLDLVDTLGHQVSNCDQDQLECKRNFLVFKQQSLSPFDLLDPFDHLDDRGQVWSLAEGALVHCLRGHTHAVRYFLICKQLLGNWKIELLSDPSPIIVYPCHSLTD